MDSSEDVSLFDGYACEFSTLIKAQSCQQSLPDDGVLRQCENLLQQMAMEARTEVDSEIKQEQLDRVRACKSQLQALRLDKERSSLISHGKQPTSATQQMLDRQNQCLYRALQTLEETEEVACGTMLELENNRSSIESTRGKAKEMNSMTDRAGEILKSMSKPWWRP